MNKTFCRFEVKCDSKLSSVNHAKYILGLGAYAHKQNEIQHSSSGNLPDWVGGDVMAFWKGCDNGETGDKSKYREHIINLPRELTGQERIDLVEAWIEQELQGVQAYSYAIHTPLSNTDGLVQPHVHLMFSDRVHDEYERDQEQYFRQYRPKNPDKGGCRKNNPRMTHKQRAVKLQEQKDRFATLCNQYLQGYGVVVDLSSRESRGLDGKSKQNLTKAEYHTLRTYNTNAQELEQAKREFYSQYPQYDEQRHDPVEAHTERLEQEQTKQARKEQREQERARQAQIERDLGRKRAEDFSPTHIISAVDDGIREVNVKKLRLDLSKFVSLKNLDLGQGHPYDKAYVKHLTRVFDENNIDFDELLKEQFGGVKGPASEQLHRFIDAEIDKYIELVKTQRDTPSAEHNNEGKDREFEG